jgi:N-acetylmuramic acid 6-phosphate (MurNAc-6-P) etherase
MDTPDDLPPTEQDNPRTRDISSRSIADIVGLINDEDAGVAQAVAKELPQVAAAVEGMWSKAELSRLR